MPAVSRKLYLAVAAALLLSVTLFRTGGGRPAAQASCGFVQNADSQRVSWGQDVPVVMYIDSSVPSAYYPAIKRAADRWNKISGSEIIKIGGVTNSPGGPAHDGSNVIYWMKTWDNPKTSEQARTTIYWVDNRISEADVLIDARPGDHDYFWGDDPHPGALDVESVVVHEFGHVLGLAHATVSGSVMVPALSAADSPKFIERRTPNAFDLSSISCEYRVPGPSAAPRNLMVRR